jgi:hypothetical protein
VVPANDKASAKSFALYQNFNLTHYWVPVPKGYWYKLNGEEKQFSSDGWYDIMTGEFIANSGGTIYLNK